MNEKTTGYHKVYSNCSDIETVYNWHAISSEKGFREFFFFEEKLDMREQSWTHCTPKNVDFCLLSAQ